MKEAKILCVCVCGGVRQPRAARRVVVRHSGGTRRVLFTFLPFSASAMGAYLSKPVTEKTSSDGQHGEVHYGASAMQGWRVSQEVRRAPFVWCWPPHTRGGTTGARKAWGGVLDLLTGPLPSLVCSLPCHVSLPFSLSPPRPAAPLPGSLPPRCPRPRALPAPCGHHTQHPGLPGTPV